MRVGLECLVGRTRVAIPVEAVDQIIEYQLTSPLPLAREFIGGLGIYEQRILFSVQLMTDNAQRGAPAQGGRIRHAKGVLLDVKSSHVGWALEVAHVASFVRVEVTGGPVSGELAPHPPWIAAAALDDGRPIAWVDVEAMVASFDAAGDHRP